MELYHNSRDPIFRSPYGAVPAGTELTLRLRVDTPDPARILLRLWDGKERMLPMEQEAGGLYAARFTAPKEPGLLWYYFVAESPAGTVCYGHPSGSHKSEGAVMAAPESWQITVYAPTVLPEWYRRSVVYQIFPDRFARGRDFEQCQSRAAHPADWKGTRRMVMQQWDDTPFYCRDEKNRVTRWPFFGGNLSGIREKLPYLTSMGVGAIYLNPIFLASSNHKYDTADYMQLDPTFGTEDDFRALCEDAKALGIRVILDGVFSHTGDDSIYFNRYGNFPEPGAWGSEESPYDSWYRFGSEHPAGYECWWGVDSLPDVEETDPGYQEYICGVGGVLDKWLSLGASGWRLDVADELPDSFIARIRAALKAHGEDTLLMGEVWEDASNKISYEQLREYLLGSELDCTMHYPFRTHALAFLTGSENADVFADAMETIRENYPPSAFYGALNLIGTHDTPRILTCLGGLPAEELTEAEKERYSLPPHALWQAQQRLKLLALLQFASPGVPSIYYGDEAGMQGLADPYNRGTFPWGHENGDLSYHFRMLSLFRKEYPVLVDGEAAYLSPAPEVMGIRRSDGTASALAYVNRSEFPVTISLPDDRPYLELLSGKVHAGSELTLQPLNGALLWREGDAYAPMSSADAPTGLGVLCPISALPGGPEGTVSESDVRSFLKALKKMGSRSWMLLPLNPAGNGNSPYSSRGLFAGDPRYFQSEAPIDEKALAAFREENADWLEDYALYTALRRFYGRAWQEWPRSEKQRRDLPALRERFRAEIDAICRQQYRFFTAWDALHEEARAAGIDLIGDLPIYAALDSADTWAHPELFLLDDEGYPTLRAGCPPDYFTPEGQDWGNPLYRWDLMEKDGYGWWKRRLGRALKQYDYVRMDHFRAFSSYYAIPRQSTAKEGCWQKGPGLKFFREMEQAFGRLPIIAEDLGSLDSMVTGLLNRTGLCGMNVWQFTPNEMQAMSAEEASRRIFFSGTHDNQTLRGYLSSSGDSRSTGEILSMLMAAPARAAIFPVQDLLDLGDEARVNVPGVPEGNWTWRMSEEMLAHLGEIRLPNA